MVYKHEVVEPCAMYTHSSWECLSKGIFIFHTKTNKQKENKKTNANAVHYGCFGV